jgi:hypothetical protein
MNSLATASSKNSREMVNARYGPVNDEWEFEASVWVVLQLQPKVKEGSLSKGKASPKDNYNIASRRGIG